VGSGSDRLVHFFVTERRQNQCRHVIKLRLRGQLFDYFNAAVAGQTNVTYDQVGLLGDGHVEPFPCVTGNNYRVSLGGQMQMG
jgi:hypothetical protein